jgi:hypothetical protein
VLHATDATQPPGAPPGIILPPSGPGKGECGGGGNCEGDGAKRDFNIHSQVLVEDVVVVVVVLC